MEITYDTTKDEANIAKHGVSLAEAENFDWRNAQFTIDSRQDYGEARTVAVGNLRNCLHVLVYTQRKGEFRIISLRKANERERRRYEQKKEI